MDVTKVFSVLCNAKKSLDSSGPASKKPRANSKVLTKPSASDFQKAAIKAVEKITKVRENILKNKKEYLDAGSILTEAGRNEIESEILNGLQESKTSLRALRNNVNHNRTQVKAHQMEVVQILDGYLASVSKLLTEQQSYRVKRALDHAKLFKLETADRNRKQHSLDKTIRRSGTNMVKNGLQKASVFDDTRPTEKHHARELFSSVELQTFESENVNLHDELCGMEDEVRKIEIQMSEISKLHQMFTVNVVVQDHQINNVSTIAVGATENIKAGNIDIREAIQKTASFRAWILFVVLVLSFTLLFLDWYNE